MMGSFLTRALILVLGYAYPAYDCYKTVELNKPEIEQLRFWCQYWILVALLTVFERVADAFISWLPMYSEAKLAFIVYLWFPKTKGTSYVYGSFFRPYIAKHETEIDRNLLELRTRAGDMAVLYGQRAINYGQTRVFQVLQYVASQSQAPTRPVQRQQQQQQPQESRQAPPAAPSTRPSAPSPQKPQPARAPPSPSKNQMQENTTIVGVPSSPSQQQASSGPSRTSSSNCEASSHGQQKEEPMQVDTTSSSANEESHPPSGETVMEETIRVTRGRLRKRLAAAGPST
ncbi:putative HVA22-like protein g [Typha angustifolia]|uniref:putative HVA22-like protein g n=1 Tax=Typha angustifolia TaxID=59011 RepID=UPI003C2AC2FD